MLSPRPEPVLLHLVDQRHARDTEAARGFGLIAAGGIEGARDQAALERFDLLLERGTIARVGCGVVGVARRRRGDRACLGGAEVGEADHAAGGERGEAEWRTLPRTWSTACCRARHTCCRDQSLDRMADLVAVDLCVR